jgi:cytochrome c biogenesis protein
MAETHSAVRKLWQTIGAIKTGVILLILVVIVSAAGTVILQRPVTDLEDMQRAYSPQTLRLLDALSLTDVFHAWWFVLLLILVSLSIVAASVQRFPNAWRFYSRPYKSPNDSFQKALPLQAQIPIDDEDRGLAIAERAFQKAGFHPERIVRESSFSLFAERNRISEMAVYIVHASLLLIFFGGIVDAIYGWSGFLELTRGQQSSQVEMRNGKLHNFPFAIRCDGAGQENYADGSPKRWWSDLTVLDNGVEVQHKQIVVNDPLVYHSVRFYQASYGPTGKVDKILLTAKPTAGGPNKEIAVGPDDPVQIDPDTTIRLVEFIPDYVVSNGSVYTRSKDVENPAAHFLVESKQSGKRVNVWLPPIEGFEQNADSPYQFEPHDLQMAHYTGLQVSHEPGQWGVWGGVLLMGLGLGVVFYMVHQRVWAVPVREPSGRLVLWIGGAANKNKDVFEQRFRKLVSDIEAQVKVQPKLSAAARETSLAGD